MKTTALRFSILAVLHCLPAMAQDTSVTGGGQSFDMRQPTMAGKGSLLEL